MFRASLRQLKVTLQKLMIPKREPASSTGSRHSTSTFSENKFVLLLEPADDSEFDVQNMKFKIGHDVL